MMFAHLIRSLLINSLRTFAAALPRHGMSNAITTVRLGLRIEQLEDRTLPSGLPDFLVFFGGTRAGYPNETYSYSNILSESVPISIDISDGSSRASVEGSISSSSPGDENASARFNTKWKAEYSGSEWAEHGIVNGYLEVYIKGNAQTP